MQPPTAQQQPHSTSTLCYNLHSLILCSKYLHTLSIQKNFHTSSRYSSHLISTPTSQRHARYQRQSHSVNLASLISATFIWPNALLIICGVLSRNQIKRSSIKLTYTPKPKYIRYCSYTTASIELELLPVSSSEVWLLDSSAEISMKSDHDSELVP